MGSSITWNVVQVEFPLQIISSLVCCVHTLCSQYNLNMKMEVIYISKVYFNIKIWTWNLRNTLFNQLSKTSVNCCLVSLFLILSYFYPCLSLMNHILAPSRQQKIWHKGVKTVISLHFFHLDIILMKSILLKLWLRFSLIHIVCNLSLKIQAEQTNQHL